MAKGLFVQTVGKACVQLRSQGSELHQVVRIWSNAGLIPTSRGGCSRSLDRAPLHMALPTEILFGRVRHSKCQSRTVCGGADINIIGLGKEAPRKYSSLLKELCSLAKAGHCSCRSYASFGSVTLPLEISQPRIKTLADRPITTPKPYRRNPKPSFL